MIARRLLAVVFVAFALAALAACGGDDDDSGSATCEPARSGSPTPAPSQPAELDGEVVTTVSGLQYIDICQGAGRSPAATDQVSVYYTGWLEAAGAKFDSSVDRGAPNNFAVNGLIPGFTEGLLTMKEGGQRRLIIPPDLAYGSEGFQGLIPPNATLIFDVEIVEIVTPGG